MKDDKAEREPLEEPRATELTPEELDEVSGGISGPPIKSIGGVVTHIPGNPI
jgi:hypothetical protein